MKTEHSPIQTPEESTSAATMNDVYTAEAAEEIAKIEVMDLRDVTRMIDICSHRILHPREDDTDAHVDYFKEQLQRAAEDLAGHVLSKEACARLGIHTEILDNQSFNHPPIREDVFRLALASEILENDTLRDAYETAIDELPDNLQVVKRRAQRALNLIKSDRSDSFLHAYEQIELADTNNDTDALSYGNSHANRFLDYGDLDPDVDYNELSINDERLERLVTPVPTSFEGKYGMRDEPRVEFYTPPIKKKLADKAIDGASKH